MQLRLSLNIPISVGQTFATIFQKRLRKDDEYLQRMSAKFSQNLAEKHLLVRR